MPRRKIDHTTEQRFTLGEYERKLAEDALMVKGASSGMIAIAGVAQGLGIFGGLGLAALLWGKDLEKLFEQLVGVWPESGKLFSPEWIAKWGDNPVDILTEDITTPDNDLTNTLDPNVEGRSFEGLSSSDVYMLACSGRASAYQHAKNNIINNWLLQNPKSHPLVGDYSQGLTDAQKATIIAQWHRENPKPPQCLTVGQQAVQIAIRITCAKRDLTYFKYVQNNDPKKEADYVDDPLLDWLSYSSEESYYLGGYNALNTASPDPYDYRSKKGEGEQLIQMFAWWSAPTNP